MWTSATSPELSSQASGNEGDRDAPSVEPGSLGQRCLFKAKRRCITTAEVMNTYVGSKPDTDQAKLLLAVEEKNNSEQAQSFASAEHIKQKETTVLVASTDQVNQKLDDASHSLEQISKTDSGKSSVISSGYYSCASSGTLTERTESRVITQTKSEVISLRVEVNALKTVFKVSELLLKQLSFDFSDPALPSPSLALLSPIRRNVFSPELIEHIIRLAYIDIVSPRSSISVSANWLKGIEFVIAHIFQYGLASEGAMRYSDGVGRCFRVLNLIAAQLPEVTDLIFTRLEMTLKKKVPTSSELHRQYIAWQTRQLCKNSPCLAIKILKTLISEFSARLVKLHQNTASYASQRSVTLSHSNLILDILLQLPKGCGRDIKDVVDHLKSIPTNANLLSLAKQDIIDHVDFTLQPYTK